MLTYGTSLTQKYDALQKVEIDQIVRKIKHPKPEFKARITQLRRIKEMNPKQYRQLKSGLPYFCCATFNPPYRKKENFAAITAFTLDFDHFSTSGLSKNDVIQKLSTDPYIRLLFNSPGGDGLKALFKLAELCRDAEKYTHFYKAFARQFVEKYRLENVVDWVTHDVTRATFFSADESAMDNPIATPVKMTDYITNEMGPEFTKIEKAFTESARSNNHEDPTFITGSPDPDTLQQIKTKLNPNYRLKKAKQVYIPQALTEVIPAIAKALAKENIKITSLKPINYGKQIRVNMDKYWAELNIFHGKKGFSIIRTTKSGSHTELGELAYQIVDTLLNT